MVGAAAAVLSPRRAAALAAVLVALVAWDAGAGVLPGLSLWPDVLVISLVVLPVTFAVPWLALPLSPIRTALPLAGVLRRARRCSPTSPASARSSTSRSCSR